MTMPPLTSPGDAAMSPDEVSAGGTLITAYSSAADERRARHRVLVKRAYHQKLGALQALRQHERELEAQCRALRQTHASVAPPAADGSGALRDLYARLAVVRADLERENHALQRLANEHERFHTLLKRAARENGRERPAAPFVTITPLTEQQCMDVIRVAYESARGFMRGRDTLSLGSEVFGWTHRYRFQDSGATIQYSIGKTFPSASAAALCQRSWEIMTSSEHYRELHSASVVTARVHVVQRVNADNVVLFRVLRRRGQRLRLKTLLVASQFQVPNGLMIIYRAVDPQRQHLQQNFPDETGDGMDDVLEADKADEEAAPPVVWLDMFAWTLFEDTGAGGVRFEFGGKMALTSSANAQFWMLEVLLLALRWETKAVGPLFTLT
ncbi:hypothetical protein PybrP1_007497 [[Pythium] brassicae (nom. inval.)]|nr:hypothetical protein PybrP1_007497 [[Pythium] brassicae (nom. inval.)]